MSFFLQGIQQMLDEVIQKFLQYILSLVTFDRINVLTEKYSRNIFRSTYVYKDF